MEKKMKSCEIIEKYLEESIIHGNIDMGREKVNKAAKELIKMNELLKENKDMAREVIDELLYSSSVNTQVWIAELAINIKYRDEEAIQLLMAIGCEKNIGIIAMNARLRLAEKNIVPIDKW